MFTVVHVILCLYSQMFMFLRLIIIIFFLKMRLSQEGYIVNNLFVIRMQHRSKTFLSIGCLDVNGLKDKHRDKRFHDYAKCYDIWCLQKTDCIPKSISIQHILSQIYVDEEKIIVRYDVNGLPHVKAVIKCLK